MSNAYLGPDRKHLNSMIQERLNRRFQNNQELLTTLGMNPRYKQNEFFISSDVSSSREPVRPEPAIHENVYFAAPYRPQASTIDYAPRIIRSDPIRQSIPIPATLAQANDYSMIISNERVVEELPNPKTNFHINADVIRETTTIVREYPSPRQEEQRLSVRAPVIIEAANPIPQKVVTFSTPEVTTTPPIQTVVTRSVLRPPINQSTTTVTNVEAGNTAQVQTLKTENEKLQKDLAILAEENARINAQFAKLQKERDSMETQFHEILEYLDIPNSGAILTKLKEYNTKLSFSEGRQISLSEENKNLELELDNARRDAKKLAQDLKNQEIHKNKEIERLTAKGNAMQVRLDRLIESLRNKKPSDEIIEQITTLDMPSESSEENARLQNQIKELQKKMVQREHEFFIKENDLLQKGATLELHLKEVREELDKANQHIQMSQLRTSLDRAPKEKLAEQQLAEAEAKYSADIDRLKTMLRTTSGELEKSLSENNNLNSNLKMRTDELQEQEVKLFEACLRVSFLSAELERLRGSLPAKA